MWSEAKFHKGPTSAISNQAPGTNFNSQEFSAALKKVLLLQSFGKKFVIAAWLMTSTQVVGGLYSLLLKLVLGA